MDTNDRPQAWVERLDLGFGERFGLDWEEDILHVQPGKNGEFTLYVLRRP